MPLAQSVMGFSIARFALGLGEAGNFPASIKTVAEWHPRKERALATGIFNAGSNVGVIVAALVVPWVTLTYGMAMGFHRDRGDGICLADRLGSSVCTARKAAAPFGRRTRIYSQRHGGQ